MPDYPDAPMKPGRTMETYKRLVMAAIDSRQRDSSLTQSFKMCVPRDYVISLTSFFPSHFHTVLGGCFTDRDEVYVKFTPIQK